MTVQDAERKALDWQSLNEDAQCEEENGCGEIAMKIRDEARAIEQELEAAGYNALQLLRQIERRRRCRN